MTILTEDIFNITLAAALGAVLGLEREWSGKSAGFRTLMLVSLGSALFTVVSYQMAIIDIKHNSDVTRIASNIVTGIGFLGAGLIFRGNQDIQGLTSAATVWTAAAIGMAAGIGNYELAVGTTIITWVILVILHRFEKFFEARFETRYYKITYHYTAGDQILTYKDVFTEKGFKLLAAKQQKGDGNITASWTIRASQEKHDAIIRHLLGNTRIIELVY